MWERELKLIENLGKLYPEFTNMHGDVFEYETCKSNYHKAWWVWYLCTIHLKQRIPRLEEFIKENDYAAWLWYKHHFKITEE